MRLIPGERDDPLLAAVSEALWEPDPHYTTEPSSVRAERLKKITAQGDRLRARWAESAALEEAYSAPASSMTRPQLVARSSRRARLRQRLIEQRLRRRRRIAVLVTALCVTTFFLAGAVVALFMSDVVSFTSAAVTVGVLLANSAVTIAAHLRLATARSEARKTSRLLNHFSRSRVPRNVEQTEERPMVTPD